MSDILKINMWNNYETPELAEQAAKHYVANYGPIECYYVVARAY